MVYFSFINIHYIICDCGNTFPTEEELKLHLVTEHTNGNVFEYNTAPIKITEKEEISSNQTLSNLNKTSVDDNLELVVLDEELEYVQFLDETNQPVLIVQVKDESIKENTEATQSDVNNAFQVQRKDRSKIKENVDITQEAFSRAMGILNRNNEPEKILDPAVMTVSKLSFEQAVTEHQRRKERKGYIEASHHCQLCYRHFHSQEQLEKHMLHHSEVAGSYVCAICKIRTVKQPALRKHVRDQHTRKYFCKICPFTTSYESIAHNHVAFHKGLKHRCPHCSKEFANLSTRETHMRLKHPARYPCGLCGYTYLSQYGVHMHRLKIHRFDIQMPLNGPYCEACDVQFASQEAHDRHLQLSSVHITDVTNRLYNQDKKRYQKPKTNPDEETRKKTADADKDPFPCELCGVEVAGLRLYGQHFQREHPGAARTLFPGAFECHLCGKLFTLKSSLCCHIRVHTEEQFQCDRCGQWCSNRSSLYLHTRAHERRERLERCKRPKNPFPCHICGTHFTLKHNLLRHVKIHQGIKPFQCEVCGKSFLTKVEKTSHVNHVHLKIPRPPRARRTPRAIRDPDHLHLKISRQPHARMRRPDQDTKGPDHDPKRPDHDMGGPDHVMMRGPNHIEINGVDHVDMKGRGLEEMKSPDHVNLKMPRPTPSRKSRPDSIKSSHERVERGPERVQRCPERIERGPDHIEMRRPDSIKSGHERVERGPQQLGRGPERVERRGPDHIEMKRPDHIEMRRPDQIEMRRPDHIEMRRPDHIEMRRPDRKEMRRPDRKEMRRPDRKEMRRPDHIQIRGPYHVDLKGLGDIDISDFDHIDMLGM